MPRDEIDVRPLEIGEQVHRVTRHGTVDRKCVYKVIEIGRRAAGPLYIVEHTPGHVHAGERQHGYLGDFARISEE